MPRQHFRKCPAQRNRWCKFPCKRCKHLLRPASPIPSCEESVSSLPRVLSAEDEKRASPLRQNSGTTTLGPRPHEEEVYICSDRHPEPRTSVSPFDEPEKVQETHEDYREEIQFDWDDNQAELVRPRENEDQHREDDAASLHFCFDEPEKVQETHEDYREEIQFAWDDNQAELVRPRENEDQHREDDAASLHFCWDDAGTEALQPRNCPEIGTPEPRVNPSSSVVNTHRYDLRPRLPYRPNREPINAAKASKVKVGTKIALYWPPVGSWSNGRVLQNCGNGIFKVFKTFSI